MSICLCYKSAAATACVHWQGPDRKPLSELHEAAPGKTLSASTKRLPTVKNTLLHDRCRKRAIPTLAEPPTLDTALDTGGSTLSKKGETITNMHSLRLTSHRLLIRERGLCVFVYHLHPIHCTGRELLHITSGVKWALILKFILEAGNTVRVD